ncbi:MULTISPECIES: DUF1189 domain-containing protein [unclassified Bacillus (in: firmicutes)]|uniref:DUF1189 domain-containing protein n=1 Tax=unclassified Bacillus (in: firmicutes) TaxID=185979 RepID=UPI001BE6902A|nr:MULTISPECIES: DUF1189 domain-containing protein [unclassified Bacillus (in: firmicutes)]MBT2636529.1 DUF1189 domain-containing protein [Bacillus sp. ISL-39]MBT2660793.1 DUF1189 domain-containing protein [Bacillus sp. ISL-45]
MNILAQIAKSIYSPKVIAGTRFQGIGKTILFVFTLTLISILPVVYYMFVGISEAVGTAKQSIQTDLPSFTIEDGTLHSDIKAPLTIKNGGFTLIFDPTGAIDQEDMTSMDANFAMLQNHIVLAAGGETNAVPYSLFTNESMTKEDIISLIDTAESSLPVLLGLVFIVVYVFSSGMKFIEVSLLALFGLLLKNLSGRNLQYRHLWRMAAYSTTLPTIFFTIMAFLKTEVPFSFSVNWFVASMMLLLAIKELPGKTPAES